MVGIRKTHIEDITYIRKIRKPMVEKKRRDRINESISQLKLLIAQTIRQNTAPMSRIDKADILELTVYHLTKLEQQQRSVTMATEAASFRAGYKACAGEAVTYLANNKMTSSTLTGSLSNHLHSSFLKHSRQQEAAKHLRTNTRGGYYQRQTDRLSTPLRPCDSFNTSIPELNLYGCSPIISSNLPELTSSFVKAGLNSSDSSGYHSPSSNTSIITNDSIEDSTNGNCWVEPEVKETDTCNDIVTIGNGKENEIGHVIKEALWRPF